MRACCRNEFVTTLSIGRRARCTQHTSIRNAATDDLRAPTRHPGMQDAQYPVAITQGEARWGNCKVPSRQSIGRFKASGAAARESSIEHRTSGIDLHKHRRHRLTANRMTILSVLC